jgi:hypothetical protein
MDPKSLARALGGDFRGGQILCPGPGHSSADRSLSVTITASGDFVVHSFAGDDPIVCRDYVRQKAGLPAWQPRATSNHAPRVAGWRRTDADIERAVLAAVNGERQGSRIVAEYSYTDTGGELLYQVCKMEPKDFLQRRPDGKGGWTWKKGERPVLYRWPELKKFPDATVFVTEGEKDADRVASLNLCATTVAMGKWTDDCAKALEGRDCIIFEDNDDAGRKKAAEAATALNGIAKTIRIVRLPDLPHRGDVSDWLDADTGHAGRLVDVCFEASLWAPMDASSTATAAQLIQSSAEFIAGFVPPDYLVDGLVQRRFIYSLTGRTGGGKTSIMLLIVASVYLGRPIGEREVQQGKVLYFAGENPDDIRMRWIALAQHMDFDPDSTEVYFIPGTFKISELMPRIEAEAKAKEKGPFALVIIDTSAAYFEGDEENSNAQQGAHARRLRELVRLSGGPCVIVACHPPKNASDENLQPRGGGAFIAEVDGNLTAMNSDGVVELHWQGKFRGPDFAPLSFQLSGVTHERLKDSRGRTIPTVIAKYLTEAAQEGIEAATRDNEHRVLLAYADNPDASLSDVARSLQWNLSKGDPDKNKVKRILKKLVKAKLAELEHGKPTLTEKGKRKIEVLRAKAKPAAR